MANVWILFLVVIPVFFSGSVQAQSLYEKMKQGNILYDAGKYDESLNVFLDAQIEAPEDVQLKYNIAASHYKMKNYEEAVKGYLDVIATAQDARLEALSLYNIGNAMYRQGKLQEAVAYYKKALELDPEDADARHNLEFVREEIKKKINESKQTRKNQQQKEQQQKESGQQSRQQQKQGDSSAQSGSDNRDRGEEESGEQQAPRPGQQEQQAQDQQAAPVTAEKESGEEDHEAGGTSRAAKMTEEEAEQWLNSLQEDKGKFKKQEKRVNGRQRSPSGKNW